MTRRSWRTYSIGEIDAAVERQQERRLREYEAEQDRLDEQRRDSSGWTYVDDEQEAA